MPDWTIWILLVVLVIVYFLLRRTTPAKRKRREITFHQTDNRDGSTLNDSRIPEDPATGNSDTANSDSAPKIQGRDIGDQDRRI